MSREEPVVDDLETPEINVRVVLAVGASVLLMIAAVIGVTFWFYRWHVPHEIAIVPKQFPQPQLLHSDAETLEDVQATARERLTTWRWVDRKAGIISIPIDIAMEKLLARPDPYAPLVAGKPAGEGR